MAALSRRATFRIGCGLGILATLALASSCRTATPSWPEVTQSIRQEFPDVRQISIEEYEKSYASRSLLVDVREEREFAVSHLPGAVHSQDPADIAARFRASGEEALVLYCSVGYRSSRMARRVQPLVDGPVYDLEGSIFAWANSGRPVFRGDERVDVVHPYHARWAPLLDEDLRAGPDNTAP